MHAIVENELEVWSLKILSIETATEACSAALLIDNSIIERYEVAPRQQSQLILPMVDEIMSEADCLTTQLDAVAFGRGPGAFTGVRLAAAVTQGIAFAADLPVLPVSTLAAMAEDTFNQRNTEHVYTAIDARMKEIYWAVYVMHQGNLIELEKEAVLAPDQVAFNGEGRAVGVGSGWATYREILTEKFSSNLLEVDSDVFPRAASIARLGAKRYLAEAGVDPHQAIPVYLRNNVTYRRNV